MFGLDNSDIVLLLIASYVAVMSLVRLMRGYRDQLFGELEQQVEGERKRRRGKKQRDDRARKRKKPVPEKQDPDRDAA